MAASPEDVYPDADEHRDNHASALHAVLQVCQVHKRLQGHCKGRDGDTRHSGDRVRAVGPGRHGGAQDRVSCQVEEHPEHAETTLSCFVRCHGDELGDCNQTHSRILFRRLGRH